MAASATGWPVAASSTSTDRATGSAHGRARHWVAASWPQDATMRPSATASHGLLRLRPLDTATLSLQLQQVPHVPVQVLEDRDGAVRLLLRLSHERDAAGDHLRMVATEV